MACHNDVAQLECNPYSRIAVYSASFGRTEYESIQCPQPQGVREESKYPRLPWASIKAQSQTCTLLHFLSLLLFSTSSSFFLNAACLASFATETVMQICHGRRRCNLAADANTFGTPCQPNSRMYLKVVYTCGKCGGRGCAKVKVQWLGVGIVGA